MATKEISYHQAEANSHARNAENRHGYYRNPFDSIPLCGNDGKNTPPRYPIKNVGACPSPSRD